MFVGKGGKKQQNRSWWLRHCKLLCSITWEICLLLLIILESCVFFINLNLKGGQSCMTYSPQSHLGYNFVSSAYCGYTKNIAHKLFPYYCTCLVCLCLFHNNMSFCANTAHCACVWARLFYHYYTRKVQSLGVRPYCKRTKVMKRLHDNLWSSGAQAVKNLMSLSTKLLCLIASKTQFKKWNQISLSKSANSATNRPQHNREKAL